MSIIRSLSTAVAASGLPLEHGGNSFVGRGQSCCGSNDKPEATTAVDKAPDDGREDARNMLSCI